VNSVDLTTSAAVAAFYARRGRLHSGRLERLLCDGPPVLLPCQRLTLDWGCIGMRQEDRANAG
jgi:hypothetical protein